MKTGDVPGQCERRNEEKKETNLEQKIKIIELSFCQNTRWLAAIADDGHSVAECNDADTATGISLELTVNQRTTGTIIPMPAAACQQTA